MYDAINYGIQISKGQIVGLIHSGDIFFNKNILKVITKIFSKNINAISANLVFKKRKKLRECGIIH